MKNLKDWLQMSKAGRLLLPLSVVMSSVYLLFFSAGLPLALFSDVESQKVCVPLATGSANRDSVNLNSKAGWFSDDSRDAQSIAWGDVDGDGDLDLAVANYGKKPGQENQVYLNQGGALLPTASWSSNDNDYTLSIAWGDVDSDGDLDLAVGNDGSANKLYLNEGGKLATTNVWTDTFQDETTSLAWGDVDGDGDLDLAVGNLGQWNRSCGCYLGAPNKVYLNQEGKLTTTDIWTDTFSDPTKSVAWGDVDRDGDLDLAVGNWGAPNKVYLNQGGRLTITNVWSDTLNEGTESVSWGDINNDGYLDLAVGNWAASNNIYLNQGGMLTTTDVWTDTFSDRTRTVAWGDVDGDGDLDLAVANQFDPDKVYLNERGVLTVKNAWRSINKTGTSNVAWGDMDGDGDLDLAVAIQGGSNKVYLNESRALTSHAGWQSEDCDVTRSVAWGDVDGDGDLDLAIANHNAPNKVYLNQEGMLTSSNVWSDTFEHWSHSVAWGDVDGDGDLDLAVANLFTSNRVYFNEGGQLTVDKHWQSEDRNDSQSVAWGDVDGDGDLDLAVANANAQNKLYLNEGSGLSAKHAWSSLDSKRSASVAWGDVDGDDDLDLAVANTEGANKLYLNRAGELEKAASWSSKDDDRTYGIAWGDVDGDGDLDLAVANNQSPNKVYLNEEGILNADDFWSSKDSDYSFSVAWADMDGDGDLDLAVGNRYGPNKVYLNEEGTLTAGKPWVSTDGNDVTASVAWGDVDGDGDLDLAVGNMDGDNVHQRNKLYLNQSTAHPLYQGKTASLALTEELASANFYAVADIANSGVIPITYTLFHPASEPVREVRAFYSPDGGGRWYRATATLDTVTENLATGPYPTATDSNTHVFKWDVLNSQFFGQSDNVVLRLEALPNLKAQPNGVPGPFLRPFVSAQSFPFRVRGSQVRVVSQGITETQSVSNALVYHLSAGQERGAQPFAGKNKQAFGSDSEGYLQGRGTIAISDTLFALRPMSDTRLTPLPPILTDSYTLYHTNAVPTDRGPSGHLVREPGVQELVISGEYPLLLFHLDLSLEWDARKDEQFMSQLRYDLQRTSELLYDWSNGQAALGKLTIYHEREKWNEADIRIYATNRMRPNATQGGIVSDIFTETVTVASSKVIRYTPGQVRMGALWNRYGNRRGTLGEDWPRALAHELGHYLFFLDDNYLGLDNQGHIISDQNCPGAMSDPYRDDYSEFHPQANWQPACEKTLSQQRTGRSDWATINTFYPWLKAPSSTFTTTNPGPSILPLALTQLTVVEPGTPPTTLDVPIFYLTQNGTRVLPGSSARAYLFQGEQQLLDLGAPTLDQVQAHGARPGDRLCVYELERRRLGCERITLGDDRLELKPVSNWQPNVIVSPVTSRTINLRVTSPNPVTSRTIKARLFPSTGISATNPITLTIDPATGGYNGTFELVEPAQEGHIHVWVVEDEHENKPRREVVTDYALGGGPVPRPVRDGDTAFPSTTGSCWFFCWNWSRATAPVISADGQVILYTDNLTLQEEAFFSLQSATRLPPIPAWATVVGQAHRLIADQVATEQLSQSNITFNYLEGDVPPGEEQWLQMYFRPDSPDAQWEPLSTTRDIDYNFASAPVKGVGLYALMSSIEIELPSEGWNLFGYPVQKTQPITQALESIKHAYITVCGYDGSDTNDPWKVYNVGVPTDQNDLQEFEYGRGYWIYVEKPVTLYLRSTAQLDYHEAASIGSPPTTISSSAIPLPSDACQIPKQIPPPEKPEPTPPPGGSQKQVEYIVQPGDTLYNIAKRHGTTVEAIIKANGLPNATIYIGQRLIIPIGDVPVTPGNG